MHVLRNTPIALNGLLGMKAGNGVLQIWKK